MKAESTEWLAKTDNAVRAAMRASTDLATFLSQAGSMSLAQRRRIVDQALVLIEQNYVHLPLKRAMHAADPVQALRLLKDRLAETTTATMSSEFAFHAEMLRIFGSVRDLHTNYVLPSPFADRVAFVPFDVEQFFEPESRYLVSHIVSGFSHPALVEGVEVVAWNGIPIDRAVEVISDRHGGSNDAARHARGVELLTQRPLSSRLPPDEAWVEVDYIGLDGSARTIRFDWLVFDISGASGEVDTDSASNAAMSMGVDAEIGALTTAKRLLFAPRAEAAGRRKIRVSSQAAQAGADVTTLLPGVFRARSVTTASGEIGHLRIFTFSVNDPHGFVDEARRLVSLLPQDRLLIDVRGNGGGHIYASEGLLQLFTPRRVTPESTQFIATALNRRICRQNRSSLGPWLPSLALAVRTGAVFSTGHPITPPDFANSIGQTYRGRVACLTDALCYSATDIFAAGFQDHEIGPIYGVDDNTGAGGANVWTHGLLRNFLGSDPKSPYAALPTGVGMRVSIRRTLRVGERAGTPLEDLGVQPDRPMRLTRADLLEGNRELLDTIAAELDGRPLRRLEASVGATSDRLTTIDLDTDEIGTLDVYVDERPYTSLSVREGANQVEVPVDAESVRFEGWSRGSLVISNTVSVG